MIDRSATRLLSIGEIFDRAVSVLLKSVFPLSLAYGIVDLPYRLLIDWLQRTSQERWFSAVGTVMANPHLLSQFFRLSSDPTRKLTIFDFGRILLDLVVAALATGSVALVTAKILHGERGDTLQTVRRAFSRWFHIIVLQFATVVAVACGLIAAIVIWALPALIWPVVRGPNELVLIMLVMFAFVSCALEAWGYCALGAIMLDNVGAGWAIRTAWKMTTAKSLRTRSFAFGLGAFACYIIGVLISLALAGVVEVLTHQVAVGVIVRELLTLAVVVFVNVAGIVFYLDAKARYAAIQDAAQNRENSAAR